MSTYVMKKSKYEYLVDFKYSHFLVQSVGSYIVLSVQYHHNQDFIVEICSLLANFLSLFSDSQL